MIPQCPPSLIRVAISNAISRRSTKLVMQANREEISHQRYIAEQFPADAISYLEEAINEAIKEWEAQYKANHKEVACD